MAAKSEIHAENPPHNHAYIDNRQRQEGSRSKASSWVRKLACSLFCADASLLSAMLSLTVMLLRPPERIGMALILDVGSGGIIAPALVSASVVIVT